MYLHVAMPPHINCLSFAVTMALFLAEVMERGCQGYKNICAIVVVEEMSHQCEMATCCSAVCCDFGIASS